MANNSNLTPLRALLYSQGVAGKSDLSSTVRPLQAMDDSRKPHAAPVNTNSPNSGMGKPNTLHGGVAPANYAKQQHPQMYASHHNGHVPFRPKQSTDDLTHGFSAMSLQPSAYGNAARPGTQMPTHSSSVSGGVPLNNAMPFMYNNGMGYPSNMYMQQHTGLPFQTAQASGYNSGSYYGYPQATYADYSPTNWMPPSRVPSGDVPSLVAPRRGSNSSNENDLPGTPFTHYTGYGNGVAIMDNSPNSVYAYSTPSPIQARFGGFVKHPLPAQCPEHLQALCHRKPAIPPAVPAPYSPQKPLEQRLVNKHGITNVYIRGLQPDTTDEMLYHMAIRFGEIDSSKAIIDHETGLCKGFGFVKYFSFKDAENCIRAFTWRGYETSFARESFYSQLKKLSEPSNTNLYISNLPKGLNEHELASIFAGFKVSSARILRNPDGSGRGVGFARFESREICEAVIHNFNNTPLRKPEYGEYVIQIRYADTPEQKALKQTTTAARQYRTAEYESQTKPQQMMRRFNGVPGPMMPSNMNQMSIPTQGRFNVLPSQTSPASTGTTMQGQGLAHSLDESSSPGDSVDGEDATITTAIPAPGAHDPKRHAESLI